MYKVPRISREFRIIHCESRAHLESRLTCISLTRGASRFCVSRHLLSAILSTAYRLPLVAVVISLVRAFDRHADVVGLSLREAGEVNAELFEVEACDLFVEDLRERIDDAAFVLDAGDSLLALGVEPEVDLGDGLVREACTHHEARVTGSAAEVQQAAFSEDKDAVTIGENPFVVLRLDFVALDARNLLEAGHVDFVVEVTDVTDDGAVLHLAHLRGADDAGVAGGGHEDVGVANHFVEGLDFVAFHGGLQSANRVDFGDDHASALAAEGLGAALTHVAVAAYDCDLAGHHHVGITSVARLMPSMREWRQP